jgi:hypothetical protein
MTRTGRIFRIDQWAFWDGKTVAGFISELKVAHEVIPDRDIAEYLSVCSEVRSLSRTKADRSVERDQQQRRDAFRQRMSDFLESEVQQAQWSRWFIEDWRTETRAYPLQGLDLFKTYFDVLNYWHYPYNCRIAFDGAQQLKTAVLSKASHALRQILLHNDRTFGRKSSDNIPWVDYCVHVDDIVGIAGIPAHFEIELRTALWQFNAKTGALKIINRD